MDGGGKSVKVIEIHHAKSAPRSPSGVPQAVDRKRKPVKHTSAGTVTPQIRALIVSEFRGGRSVVQIGKEYSVAVDVVLEFCLRDLERLVMRRAA